MLLTTFAIVLSKKMILTNFHKKGWCLGGAQRDFALWRRKKSEKFFFRKTLSSN